MAGDLVLITGGSGHLGLRVILDTLQAGFRVRAAVRSQAKADKISSVPSIKSFQDKLSFAIVPDLLVQRAYDEAVSGVSYIIHVASPTPSAHKEGDDFETSLIQPAIKGTTNILLAAQKTSSVKRIVITSSIVAVLPFKDFIFGTSETIFDENSRTASPSGPYAHVFEAYGASKIHALNEAEAWIAREKPHFDLVHIFPAFIIGKDELITDVKHIVEGTNATVLAPVIGGSLGPTPSASIHLYDVSLAHVRALGPSIQGGQGLMLASEGLEGTQWEKALEIVAREFDDEVKSGILPNNGSISTRPVKFDERRSEEILGFKFRGFEEQVENVVAHFLELKSASA